jgi:hypothetical protein
MYWPNGEGTIAGHNSQAVEAPSLIWNLLKVLPEMGLKLLFWYKILMTKKRS